MRRKVVGFLLLALVVCAGIVFVELTSGRTTKIATAGSTNDSLFCAVLGGSPPQPEVESTLESPIDENEGNGDPGERLRTPPDPQLDPGVAPTPVDDTPPREVTHRVRSGETLTRIAQDYFGSGDSRLIARIATRNALREKNAIRPGDELVIPVERFDVHVATGTESLADIAQARFQSIKALAPLVRFNPKLGSTPSSRPTKGTRIFIPR